jgi:hypothetical protein
MSGRDGVQTLSFCVNNSEYGIQGIYQNAVITTIGDMRNRRFSFTLSSFSTGYQTLRLGFLHDTKTNHIDLLYNSKQNHPIQMAMSKDFITELHRAS